MSQFDFDTMADAELADYQYTHRDDPLGDEADLEEVEIDIAHRLSVSMSFRLPPDEASEIRAAAERAGISVSDWIRGVCAGAADSAAPVAAPVPRQRVNMAKARRLVAQPDKELKRAVDQMESSRKVRRSTGSKATSPRSQAGSDNAEIRDGMDRRSSATGG